MSHDPKHLKQSSKNLRVAFFLNVGFTLFELFGGVYVNSIAIISDAVHDLGDSMVLGTAWFLQARSAKAADAKFSFGYHRFSLAGALISSLVLIAGSIYIVYQAVGRIIEPEESNAAGMLVFAVVGVVVNGYAAWRMHNSRTLNERVISWHLIEDVLGWCAVLVAAVILLFADVPYLDPALSLVITAYILWNVLQRLREALILFLQGQPEGVDRDRIEHEIVSLELVDSVHHTHIWSLDGEHHVFSTHVKLKPVGTLAALLETKNALKDLLSKYDFAHCTVETELADEECGLLAGQSFRQSKKAARDDDK